MNKYFCKLTACFVLIIILLLTPITAFSMDTAFINKTEIWYERQDIVNTPEKSLDKYNGNYSYCIDKENHCFYLHISYTEKSLTDGDNDIKVQFEIENMNESYDFYINKNGFVSPDDKIKKAFNLEYNFGEDTKQGQEIYLGLEFKKKTTKLLIIQSHFQLLLTAHHMILPSI